MQHTISIVVSHTGTGMAKLIRAMTGSYYNHCSIALDNNFNQMYSFSRRYRPFWFTGCFTTENIDILKTKNKLNAKIYTLTIDSEEYDDIVNYLNRLSKHVRIYNYLMAGTVVLQVPTYFKNHQVCSTFTAYVLDMIGSVKLNKHYSLYAPNDIKILLDKQPEVEVQSNIAT